MVSSILDLNCTLYIKNLIFLEIIQIFTVIGTWGYDYMQWGCQDSSLEAWKEIQIYIYSPILGISGIFHNF